MTDLDEIRRQILDAKETRWKKQIAYIDQFHSTIVSFKFNIPSWPKNSELIDGAWEKSFQSFRTFLEKNQVSYDVLENIETVLGPETLLKVEMSAVEFKKLAIKFEESYSIGRLLDVDVISTDKTPIDRSVKRQCYICDDISINCLRSGKHTPIEAREKFDELLKQNL